MKKFIYSIILMSFIISSCSGKDYSEFKKQLLGTWNPESETKIIPNIKVPNVSAIFYDIERTKNTSNIIVNADANSDFEVISINRTSRNLYKCHLTEDDKFIQEVKIKFLANNIIHITPRNSFFAGEIYHKITNLDLDANNKFTPSVNKLSLRETPTLKAKRKRMLTSSDKVDILETGKFETIDNVDGFWVKVKTEKGEIGWCFDAYLEEVKE